MKLKFKKVINADGKMTTLGVSTFSDNVAEAMKFAGQNFFIMKEFQEQVNEEIGKIIGSELACVVNSASSGIALSVAASIYKEKIYDVNKISYQKNEVIIAKGHNVDFGAPIENLIYLVGGKIQEAGFANQCTKKDFEYQINEKTAALMYVVSHHCVQKNMLTLHEAIEIAQKNNIVLIVDCAAEQDFQKYAKLEIDAIIFSGSKAIEGPTSGFVFGKNKELISNIKKHLSIIGRAMKIGKENMLGLLEAIKNYKFDRKMNFEIYESIFKTNKYISISKSIDNRGIERIKFTLNNLKISTISLLEHLKEHDPAIYLRSHLVNLGILEIDLRNLTVEDAKIINRAIENYLGGNHENQGN